MAEELWRELADLKTEIKTLRKEVELRFDSVAPRGWVQDILKPIEQAITKIETAIQGQADVVGDIGEQIKTLFTAHDQFLKEKAAQERKELEGRTALGYIKRFGPVVAFVLSMVTLFRVAGTVLELWLQQHK